MSGTGRISTLWCSPRTAPEFHRWSAPVPTKGIIAATQRPSQAELSTPSNTLLHRGRPDAGQIP